MHLQSCPVPTDCESASLLVEPNGAGPVWDPDVIDCESASLSVEPNGAVVLRVIPWSAIGQTIGQTLALALVAGSYGDSSGLFPAIRWRREFKSWNDA